MKITHTCTVMQQGSMGRLFGGLHHLPRFPYTPFLPPPCFLLINSLVAQWMSWEVYERQTCGSGLTVGPVRSKAEDVEESADKSCSVADGADFPMQNVSQHSFGVLSPLEAGNWLSLLHADQEWMYENITFSDLFKITNRSFFGYCAISVSVLYKAM